MTAFSAPPSASPSVTVISCCTITEYLHMLCGWCLRASVEHFQPKEDGLLKISSASLLLYFLSASRNVLATLTLCCYYGIYFCQPVGMYSSCSNCFVIITVSIFCQPVGMHSPRSHFVAIIVSIFCQPVGMHSPCSHRFVVIIYFLSASSNT